MPSIPAHTHPAASARAGIHLLSCRSHLALLLCALLPAAAVSASPGLVNVDPHYAVVGESGQTAILTVTRSVGVSGAISVDYENVAAHGTATAGSDYLPVANGTLFWAHGDNTSRQIAIDILDDANFELSEYLRVTLSNPGGGAVLGTAYFGTVEIIDDDPNLYGLLNFDPYYLAIDEGAGSVTLSVTRSGGSNGSVAVDYASVNSTATAGSDFQPIPGGTLYWGPGDLSAREIVVNIIDDAQPEQTEMLRVRLENATGGALIGQSQEGRVEIIDDDASPAGELNFAPWYVSVGEDDRVVMLTVTRTGGADGAISVDYSNSLALSTATHGTDYLAIANGTLSWPHGDATPRHIEVTLLDDDAFEATEWLRVTLSNPSGDVLIGSASAGVVEIVDDEAMMIFVDGFGDVP